MELKKVKNKNQETDGYDRDNSRGVDPYGTGGTRPPNIWTGGHYHECPPQYF